MLPVNMVAMYIFLIICIFSSLKVETKIECHGFGNRSRIKIIHRFRIHIVLIAASGSVKNDVLLLQECRKLADIPIVVLGKNDEKYSINMLYSGADDYLKLPCSRQVLDTVIYIHIRREHR